MSVFFYRFTGKYKSEEFKPLYCQFHQIGFVSKLIEKELLIFHDIFVITQSRIDICPGLNNYEEITEKVGTVITHLRKKEVIKAKPEWIEMIDVRTSW